MLTVPSLMLLGMPADHANGTNGLGILRQSLTGVRGFNRSGGLEQGAILPMLIPTASGPAPGALSSTWLHPDVLKLALLGAMVEIALVMLVSPEVVAPPEGGKHTPCESVQRGPHSVWRGCLTAGSGRPV